jgi:hypothetical protein
MTQGLGVQNVDMAASELIVHKNTVRYRRAQAAELIGHLLSERRAHLELALRYLDWYLPIMMWRTASPAVTARPA